MCQEPSIQKNKFQNHILGIWGQDFAVNTRHFDQKRDSYSAGGICHTDNLSLDSAKTSSVKLQPKSWRPNFLQRNQHGGLKSVVFKVESRDPRGISVWFKMSLQNNDSPIFLLIPSSSGTDNSVVCTVFNAVFVPPLPRLVLLLCSIMSKHSPGERLSSHCGLWTGWDDDTALWKWQRQCVTILVMTL